MDKVTIHITAPDIDNDENKNNPLTDEPNLKNEDDEENMKEAYGLFQMMDDDQDGFITAEDIVRLMGGLDKNQIDEIMSFFTTNENNKISFPNFYSRFDKFMGHDNEDPSPSPNPSPALDELSIQGKSYISTSVGKNIKPPPMGRSLTVERISTRRRSTSDEETIRVHMEEATKLNNLFNQSSSTTEHHVSQADTNEEVMKENMVYRQENDVLKLKLQNLSNKVKQWKEHVLAIALEELNSQYNEQIENFQTKLKHRKEEINQIEYLIEMKENALKIVKDRESNYTSVINELKHDNEFLKNEKFFLEQTRDELTMKNSDLEAKITELDSKTTQSSKIDIRRKILETKNQQRQQQIIRELQTEKSNLQKIVDEHSNCVKEIQNKEEIIITQDHFIQSLQTRITNLEYNALGSSNLDSMENSLSNLFESETIEEKESPIEKIKPTPTDTNETSTSPIVSPSTQISPQPKKESPIDMKSETTVDENVIKPIPRNIEASPPALSWRINEEIEVYRIILNKLFDGDDEEGIEDIIPLEQSGHEFFDKILKGGGLILAHLINFIVDDTIDLRAWNYPINNTLSSSHLKQNLNLLLSASRSISISTMDLTTEELKRYRQHEEWILRFIGSLIKSYFLKDINTVKHKSLLRLAADKEEKKQMEHATPENLLFRWFSWHLKQCGYPNIIQEYGADTCHGLSYISLIMHLQDENFQFDPSVINEMGDVSQAEKEKAPLLFIARQRKILAQCTLLKCQVEMFNPSCLSHTNPRIHLLFLASIFHSCSNRCLPTISKEVMDEEKKLSAQKFYHSRRCSMATTESNQEERVLRLWINSLEMKGIVFVNNLAEDCKDGLILLKLEDTISPGIVNYKKVQTKNLNRFKMVNNCNLAVEIAQKLHCSLVGIGGMDIVDGNIKFITSVVWQLMRLHVLKEIQRLQAKLFGGKSVTEDDIILWANERVKKKGKKSKMKSFKDPTLTNCHFFIDLLWAIDPRLVDWDEVNEGTQYEEKLLNARYALSVARKLGADVFIQAEDIVLGKPKMIQMFICAILAVDKL